MSGALSQLIGKNQQDYDHLIKNGGVNIFASKLQRRFENSSRELIPIHPINDDNEFLISRHGDLVKEIWFDVTIDSTHPVADVANHDANVRPTFIKSTDESIRIVYPVPLALMDQFMPLISLSNNEIKVHIRVADAYRESVVDSKLCAMYYFLESVLRREFCANPSDYIVWSKREQRQELDISSADVDSCITFDDKIWNGPTRELFILIKNKDHDPEKVNVHKLFLTLKGHQHQNVDAFWYNKIFPEKYYRVNNSKKNLFYYPFDDQPLDREASSSINFKRMDAVKLILRLEPGGYDLLIAGRVINLFKIENGALFVH